MEILRAGTRASTKGPEAWFTGTVRIDPLFNPFDAERVQGAQVTFEPGARTAWRTHPLGQTLIVVSGFEGCSARVALWKTSAPAIPCGSHRAKGTGTGGTRCRHDAYRASGSERRQGRGLDGARHGRSVWWLKRRPKWRSSCLPDDLQR